MDPPKELSRLGGRRQELERALERLRERRGGPGYPQKVPPHVQEADAAKVGTGGLGGGSGGAPEGPGGVLGRLRGH